MVTSCTNAAYTGSLFWPAWLTKRGLVVASVMSPVSASSLMIFKSPVSTESTVMEASCASWVDSLTAAVTAGEERMKSILINLRDIY